MLTGHIFTINGIPSGDTNGQFVLRLQGGKNSHQALNFNPRFEPVNAIILNSMNDNLRLGYACIFILIFSCNLFSFL